MMFFARTRPELGKTHFVQAHIGILEQCILYACCSKFTENYKRALKKQQKKRSAVIPRAQILLMSKHVPRSEGPTSFASEYSIIRFDEKRTLTFEVGSAEIVIDCELKTSSPLHNITLFEVSKDAPVLKRFRQRLEMGGPRFANEPAPRKDRVLHLYRSRDGLSHVISFRFKVPLKLEADLEWAERLLARRSNDLTCEKVQITLWTFDPDTFTSVCSEPVTAQVTRRPAKLSEPPPKNPSERAPPPSSGFEY